MTPFGLKIAATIGLTSGVTVGLMEAALAASGVTGSPITDGLVGGSTIAAATWAVYKYKVDRLEKRMDEKADKDVVEPALARIERQLDTLTSHLLK